MSQMQPQYQWIDALSGMISPTGADCGYLADTISQWATAQWPASRGAISGSSVTENQTSNILEQATSDLRELTGHDETVIASCLTAASGEDLLQWAVVLCRRHRQAGSVGESGSNSRSDNDMLGARCLAAVGSDHGSHVVGRMLSGRADRHDSVWPLVPGFLHAPLDTLHLRIDDSVAMVLIAPMERHNMLRPVTAECLTAIRAACDRHGACLVIDHRNSPPLSGDHFWIHESLADVTADAVLMSAGLTGGDSGGLLVLNQALAEMIQAGSDGETEMLPSVYVAQLVAATLRQWSEHSWQSVSVDEFASALAQRLAGRECVRDLHVTGRSIGIELDLPSKDWIRAAAEFSLRVTSAGEFAIALEPPLVLSPAEQAELLDRIDLVFDSIEAAEKKGESQTASISQTEHPVVNEEESEEHQLEDNENENYENEDYENENNHDAALKRSPTE